MSWSSGIRKPIQKIYAEEEILNTRIEGEGDHVNDVHKDQLQTAQRAAIEIVKNIPGPYVTVSMNGHGNGVGWQGKEGWANDTITVTVTQVTEADLKHYK